MVYVNGDEFKGHSGYRTHVRAGKLLREHRMVVEKAIGRSLFPTEVVHHKNGNRADNSLDNLEIVDNHQHGLIHHPPTKPTSSVCVICGTVFVPHKTKRGRTKTCSKSCMCTLLKRQWEERRLSRSRSR